MTTALALIDETQYSLMAKLAKVAAMAGYSQQTEVQVFFLMLKGFELGISPMQAIDGIQVIKGKTTVSPQLMLALINRSGQMQDLKIEGSTEQCTVTMTRVGRSAHTETFTMDNARSMNLAGNHNWKAQPATMLKWRAVSACARIVFPDIIQGVYSPKEMGGEVSEDASGEIVIEAPILAANFTQTENAVAQLVAKNPPPNVDTDGVIVDAPETSQKATPSDLDAQNQPDIATPEKTPAERLAGNGAPPAGEQKRIGTDKPFVYDRIGLFMAAAKVKALADINSAERNNTIIAMEGEGAFKDATSYEQCVEMVVARINSPEHGKSKKTKKVEPDQAVTITSDIQF